MFNLRPHISRREAQIRQRRDGKIGQISDLLVKAVMFNYEMLGSVAKNSLFQNVPPTFVIKRRYVFITNMGTF